MNGVEVTQSTVMQQIFEISATEVTAYAPCEGMMTPELAQEAQKQHYAHRHHPSKFVRKMSAWIQKHSPIYRIMFSLLTGTLFGLFVVMVIRVTTRVFAYARGYKRVSSDPAAVVIFDASDEKRHFLVVSGSEKNATGMLPEYQQ
jgi:hypothetical protein